MDRRQQKTRKAIYAALSRLLERKRFEHITVQEIIDAADIGRSTFYAHFETKDDLLKAMCTDIFRHVFTEELPQEAGRDFSTGMPNLELKLGHVLYHLRESRISLKGIFNGESGELFMRFLKAYLRDLFGRYKEAFSPEIPEDFVLHHLTGSFAEAVKWWITEDAGHTPEEVAAFFMAMAGRRTQCGHDATDLREAKNMTAMEAMAKRHSYRGKYRPDPVPREDLRRIMEAGLAAPSGCNKQTTSLIAVDDPQVLARLHAVIDPPVGESAPAMICVLTKRIIAYRDRCFAVQDYAAAIENMLLAIVELGYQSCWYEGHITDLDRIGERMAQILGVPDGMELVCFLPVGIAEETPAAPKKRPFEERAWFNGFECGE